MLSSRPVVVLMLLAALSGCSDIPAPDVEPVGPPPRLAGTPSYDARLEPASAVLPFVPATATTLTVTDLDRVRAQIGVPDLTSDDLMSDREEFWRRAELEAPLLAQGMLRAVNSELMLGYGFTQDDVDWEAHFTGEDGNGFVLGFRAGVDMSEVARAVRDGVGPLGGALVLAAEHLVVAGGAEDGHLSWATDPAMVDLVGSPAEATYARRGCIPLADALGPEATAAQQRTVLARHDVTDLDPLPGFALEFGDHLATVRMDPELGDLFDRLHLGDDWPAAGSPEFESGYTGAVGDPTTGRIGYDVANPPLAARIALLETLPFGVCNEVTPIPEPTG
ncbi:MAG TPA: hypothetical protein VFT00_04950 [Nocardioides sp.]|nr:hypothetical protein [Nocardioides sp.]